MERASQEGQKHYLLKCLDAELGDRMLDITDATTPIFNTPGLLLADPRTATIHILH